MDCIIVNYKPFIIEQTIFVVKDNETITIATVPIDRLNETIKGLSNMYSIDNVKLKGSKDILQKYQKDLLSEYDYLKIEII